MKITRRYSALTAGVSYDLLRVSRFAPYLKAGTGIYYGSFARGPSKGFLPPTLLAYYGDGFSESHFSLGVNGGLGLKVRLGSHEIFIEQMLHTFDVRRTGTGVYPLNIGIRF
jgi:hypothetical protein